MGRRRVAAERKLSRCAFAVPGESVRLYRLRRGEVNGCFYPHFHLAPPAKAEIRVCADMSCHLNGADRTAFS
ncbi:MAG: hypothetical protein DMG39_13235 [Acidobacteria bacterium]|nr:MAG: hypothetical protein DMG39_13235 [Acidobacteriota bacterium]